MIWQTPTISLAIIAVILAALVSQKLTIVTSTTGNAIALLIIFGFAFAVSLVGTIQLRKHRLFSNERVEDLYAIAGYLYGMSPQVYPVRYTTTQIKADWIRGPPARSPPVRSYRRLDRLSAYDWLFGLMTLLTISLGVGAILLPILAAHGLLA
jgi:hypothetical protein